MNGRPSGTGAEGHGAEGHGAAEGHEAEGHEKIAGVGEGGGWVAARLYLVLVDGGGLFSLPASHLIYSTI